MVPIHPEALSKLISIAEQVAAKSWFRGTPPTKQEWDDWDYYADNGEIIQQIETVIDNHRVSITVYPEFEYANGDTTPSLITEGNEIEIDNGSHKLNYHSVYGIRDLCYGRSSVNEEDIPLWTLTEKELAGECFVSRTEPYRQPEPTYITMEKALDMLGIDSWPAA